MDEILPTLIFYYSMIIDTSQGNVEVIGDIKEFKTSIDPKNLEFITTLLSSNLYSDPEQSFIREIVSNAWDSHVEAGTTDTPVIVRFRRFGSENTVTIRDYGVGLSPERFQEVYCNIGSSTKRESNDFIGGFGIGKYSSLACSNTVYITSFYEGTAYYYVMVKSGNSITTNLLMERPTDEKNGVEVTIKNVKNITPYNKALQYIIFFPNVYIDGAEDADKINNAKLKRFKNFAAASISVSSKLLLGNVLYPIDSRNLSQESIAFLSKLTNTGIVIKFDVGELNITPNRESIIYSSDTINKINTRIAAAKAELDSMIDHKLTCDYDDLIKYYKSVSSIRGYDPITDSLIKIGGYRVEPKDMTETSITYKGVDLRGELPYMRAVVTLILPNFKGAVCGDKIYTKPLSLPWEIRTHYQLCVPKLIVLNTGARLIESAKSYLRENYDEYSIITNLSESEFSEYVKKELQSPYVIPSATIDFIISGVYHSIMKNSVKLDLNKDAGFLSYKEALYTNRGKGPKEIKESILYVWNPNGYREKRTFRRFSHTVSFIKGLRSGVILANMNADDQLLSTVASLKGYTYIKARKDIVRDLKELNLTCIVDVDWLTNKDPTLSIVKTLIKYFPNELPIQLIDEVRDNLDKNLQSEFLRLCSIDKKFRRNFIYRSLAISDSIPYDQYTEYLCIKLRNYLAKHKEAKELIKLIGDYDPILITAVIIKTKAYRVSNDAYNRFRNNKLLNVLCRK